MNILNILLILSGTPGIAIFFSDSKTQTCPSQNHKLKNQNQRKHPVNAAIFSIALSRFVLTIEYRLRGELRKQAVINTHFGTAFLTGRSGNTEQKGHSISPLSLCPHLAHRLIPIISSVLSLSICYRSQIKFHERHRIRIDIPDFYAKMKMGARCPA